MPKPSPSHLKATSKQERSRFSRKVCCAIPSRLADDDKGRKHRPAKVKENSSGVHLQDPIFNNRVTSHKTETKCQLPHAEQLNFHAPTPRSNGTGQLLGSKTCEFLCCGSETSLSGEKSFMLFFQETSTSCLLARQILYLLSSLWSVSFEVAGIRIMVPIYSNWYRIGLYGMPRSDL